jgi:hypothetical protein
MLTSILAASVAALAQGIFAWKGTARDFTGYVISGVSVKVRNVVTGIERQTVSGPDGAYVFADLAAGTYSLTASASGFETAVIVEVEVREGRASEFDLELKVAAVTESVEVSSAPAFRCPTLSTPPDPSALLLWDLPRWQHFTTNPVLVRDGFARRRTPGGLAPLGLPTFRGGQNRECVVVHVDSCSRPAQ